MWLAVIAILIGLAILVGVLMFLLTEQQHWQRSLCAKLLNWGINIGHRHIST